MESVAENDEELIEIFLETGELSTEQLKKGIREGVLKHGLVLGQPLRIKEFNLS